MTDTASLRQLVPDVYILESPFVESKRGLIVDKAGSVLIDTSISFDETRQMLNRAEVSGYPVRRIVLTHSHFDHSAGCQLLPDGERIAQRGAGAWMLSDHAANYLAGRPPEHPDLLELAITLPTLELEGEATLRLDQRPLHLIPTPGHSPDSMSALLEPEGILFVGDALVTCFPPIIQDGDSTDTVASLKRILELDFAWLVPGHGPVLDSDAARRHCKEHLTYLETIKHRLSRITDPDTPIETVVETVDDVRSILALPEMVVASWHPKVVAKIWDEHRE